MKKLILFLFAACVAAPPTPSPVEPQKELLAQWKQKVINAPKPERLSAMAAAPSTETLTLRQCSATVQGHLAAYMSGDRWVVQVPQEGCQLMGYSGGTGGTGATLDLPGSESHGDEAAGYIPIHKRQIVLPRRVYAGQSLIVYSGAENPGSRGDYAWQAGGRPSNVDQAMPVVFVSWMPGPDYFGPPALGGILGFWPVFFRHEGVPKSIINDRLNSLPRIIDPADLTDIPLSYCEGLVSRFCGDVHGGWATDQWTPDHQHEGYGRDVASSSSNIALWLMADIPAEQKRRLAESVCQWGFDLLAAYADSPTRRADVDGGHQCGRKFYVVMFGHLTGIEPIADISDFIGPMFQEDRACHLLPNGRGWWWNPQWRVTHSYKDGVPSLNGDCVMLPPAQWTGGVAENSPGTQKWAVQGYTNPWAGTQIGTAMLMKKIGRARSWSPLGVQFIEQWMSDVPAAVKQEMASATVRLDFGKDTSHHRGAGVQEKCWRKY